MKGRVVAILLSAVLLAAVLWWCSLMATVPIIE